MQCFALLCVLKLPSLALPLRMKSERESRYVLCVGASANKRRQSSGDDQSEDSEQRWSGVEWSEVDMYKRR